MIPLWEDFYRKEKPAAFHTLSMCIMSELKAGDAVGMLDFRIYPHWMDNFGEEHCEELTMI